MANADSGLEQLATRLAEAVGAAPGEASWPAALAGQQEPGEAQAASNGANDAGAALTAAVEQLRSVAQVQADATGQNTAAIKTSTSPQTSAGSGSTLDTLGSAAANILENGLGLAPLISGLASLFGGGAGATTPPALDQYTAPEAMQFEGDVDRSANVTDWGGSGGARSGTPLSTNAQITVQVNAMDSQSFLDHSQDIANAVRQAMLNSNSLNDVVGDL